MSSLPITLEVSFQYGTKPHTAGGNVDIFVEVTTIWPRPLSSPVFVGAAATLLDELVAR